MSTETVAYPAAEGRQQSMRRGCADDFVPDRPDEASGASKSLDRVLVEHVLVNQELKRIKQTLRSLSPGFSRVHKMIEKLMGNRTASFLRPRGRSSLPGKAFNFLILLAGFVFFKTRLAAMFRFITEESEVGIFEIEKEREQFPQQDLILEIVRSRLFDSHYYLAQAPQAIDYRYGPVAHYIQFGQELNPHRLFDVRHFFCTNVGVSPSSDLPPLLQYIRSTGVECYSPHPLFDARFYMQSNPDLQPVSQSINPLIHYLTEGKNQGRDPHPLFFNGYYMNRYGQKVNTSSQSPLEHFLIWGCTGKFRPSELFDCQYYLSQRPWLRETLTNPLLHYIVSDKNERACPHRLFDEDYYLTQVPDRETASPNPLSHFLHSDIGRRCSPHPLFDVEFYLSKYPHVAKENFHAFLHYLRLGEDNGYSPNRFFYPNWFRVRSSNLTDTQAGLLENYVKLSESERITPHPLFDPEFYIELSEDLKDVDVDPLTHYFRSGKEQGISLLNRPVLGNFGEHQDQLMDTSLDHSFRMLLEHAREPFSHLFFIPGLQKGGAERATCNYIQYLQDRYGKDQVFVISSLCEEHSCMEWLPDGTRFFDLAKLNKVLSWDDITLILACFVVEKKPRSTHVVNNYHYLQAMTIYRDFLEQCSRHVIYLFGYDVYAPGGVSSLDSEMMRNSVGWADCLLTDNKKLVGLIEEYLPERSLPEKVIECCYTASVVIDNLLDESMRMRPENGKRVLWASRLAEPKRPDLLVSIARKLPDVEFVVYGSTETGGSKSDEYLSLLQGTSNIHFRGEFSEFGSIDRSDIALFLYTSCSDGLPIVLLEAAASALPVIAPKVGGIPEFVSNDTGWLVERFDDVDTYCRCIEECLANPQMADVRAQKARQLVRERHSQSAVQARLENLKDFF